MTGLEFLAAGVAFERTSDGLQVRGPAGRSDLLDQLRFEIATRLDLVAADGIRWVQRPYLCDACGDQIGHDLRGRCVLCELRGPDGKKLCRFVFGGFCDLCALARQKVLRERRAAGRTP